MYHSSKHLHYLSAFYTFVYISESFSLHVIFEYVIVLSVEKYVHRIQTQFVLNDTIKMTLILFWEKQRKLFLR
jgi:hypothetical protein